MKRVVKLVFLIVLVLSFMSLTLVACKDGDADNSQTNSDAPPATQKIVSTEGFEYSYNPSSSSYTVTGYTGTAKDVAIPAEYDDGTNGTHAVTEIGERAFVKMNDENYVNTTITSMIIPDSVVKIGDGAFFYCIGLTSITIGNSVTEIGRNAFSYCFNLIEVYNKSSLNITCGSEENGGVGLYAKNVYTTEGGSKLTTDSAGYVIYTDGADKILVAYAGSETELTLPSGITEIYQFAFYGCTNITSVAIGGSVTTIGDGAFSGCTGLTSITIGNSVATIGDYAFSGCTGLTSITIGNSVTTIGDGAFSGCTGLTSVTIPDSVTTIGDYAFYNCRSLSSAIPESVTSIGKYAFYYTMVCGGVHTPDATCVCTVCGATAHTFDTESHDCARCDALEPSYVNEVLTTSQYVRNNSIIYFGSYPQTRVDDSALCAALNDSASTLPTADDSGAWTSYGYYIDGRVSNYMWYQDVEKDGVKYRGVYFTSYRPYFTTNTTSSYQDDNGYYTSTVYWFKYEPIKWSILTESDGKAMILADLALDSQAYQNTYTYVDELYYNNNSGTPAGTYANNYEYSTIRAWLNDTFYNTAFTDLQKELIETTNVDNSAASTGYSSNSYACANTNDKIFLLSYKEETTYLTSSTLRQKKSTDYAKSQGCFQSASSGYEGNCYRWLRSPYYDSSCYARYVYYDGSIDNFNYVNYSNYGVLPALVIRLS